MNIRPYLFVMTVDVQTRSKKCIISFLVLNTPICNAVVKFTKNLWLTGAFVIQKSGSF